MTTKHGEQRELDAQVHRLIFGLEARSYAGTYPGVPCYSSEIHRAWQVVEALRGRGIVLTLCDLAATGGGWDVFFYYGEGGAIRAATAREDTAPLAIVQAALLAVEQR